MSIRAVTFPWSGPNECDVVKWGMILKINISILKWTLLECVLILFSFSESGFNNGRHTLIPFLFILWNEGCTLTEYFCVSRVKIIFWKKISNGSFYFSHVSTKTHASVWNKMFWFTLLCLQLSFCILNESFAFYIICRIWFTAIRCILTTFL